MERRGVTRPMAGSGDEEEGRDDRALRELLVDESEAQVEDPDSPVDRAERLPKLVRHHVHTLWVYWTLILLGVWTMLAPVTFGYDVRVATPSGGRELWLSDAMRVALLTWSDVVCGFLLVVLGWRSLRPNRPVSLWACCFVGIWMSLAPLVFWAPTAAAYLNGTLVGALVVALTILVPGMPNMILYMKMGPPVPPGWSYNPSSWPQRWIMIAAGFLGWVVSRYLAAYQMGYIDTVWDPFFGDGTRKVLDSNMSHSLPVSDAALGTFAYTFEFLMGWMGSPSRWRTMPWMVTFFGILVIPLGLVHIVLVISQPVVVGHWCTFCLLAAAIMIPMIPLEVDEVIAMAQHVKKSVKRGDSFWKTFWKGGSHTEGEEDERSPALAELPARPGRVFLASIWGMSFPWTLVAAAALGVFAMATPGLFGTTGTPADALHLAGALVVTVSVIAMGEVVRLLRFVNLPLALVIAGGAWLGGADMAVTLVATALALAVALLSVPRGPVRERYGSWQRWVR